jgi:hypothetical protein
MTPAPDRLQPAFYGGVVIGVLSALPLVNAGNCCCCLWVIAGGALTSYLMQQNHPYPIRVEDGLLGGLFAGMIGGAIAVVLSIPLQYAMGDFQQRFVERMASNPDVPEQTREMLENLTRRAGGFGVLRLVSGFIQVCIDAVFGMLGGLLGVALFKKKDVPPPPGTTEVLPPA